MFLLTVIWPPVLAPIRTEVAEGQAHFTAATAGRVVPVPDPQTGGALLTLSACIARVLPAKGMLDTAQTALLLLLAPAAARQAGGYVLI